MFVFNCKIRKEEVLKYPKDTFESEITSKKKGRNKKKNAKQEEVEKIEQPNEKEIEYDSFNPVVCEICGVEVGVYEDKDELYHFFNVLASHS
jgi:hypothetical protein